MWDVRTILGIQLSCNLDLIPHLVNPGNQWGTHLTPLLVNMFSHVQNSSNNLAQVQLLSVSQSVDCSSQGGNSIHRYSWITPFCSFIPQSCVQQLISSKNFTRQAGTQKHKLLLNANWLKLACSQTMYSNQVQGEVINEELTFSTLLQECLCHESQHGILLNLNHCNSVQNILLLLATTTTPASSPPTVSRCWSPCEAPCPLDETASGSQASTWRPWSAWTQMTLFLQTSPRVTGKAPSTGASTSEYHFFLFHLAGWLIGVHLDEFCVDCLWALLQCILRVLPPTPQYTFSFSFPNQF